MDDRTRNEGDPPPDAATERMEPPPLPGYGQPPPAARPADVDRADPATRRRNAALDRTGQRPAIVDAADAGRLDDLRGRTAGRVRPREAGRPDPDPLRGVLGRWSGARSSLVGRALEDFDIPELQQTIVVNGEISHLCGACGRCLRRRSGSSSSSSPSSKSSWGSLPGAAAALPASPARSMRSSSAFRCS